MAAAAVVPLNHPHLSPITSFRRTSSLPLSSSAPSPAHYLHHPLSHGLRSTPLHPRTSLRQNNKHKGLRVGCSAGEPLKVMISGAPASGKGTQCEMITSKYGLVHISTGDLLRAEVSSGTDTGKKVKEYIENGLLVPDEIITDMVISRISQQDVRERGWLLDGYPRNTSQAQMLEKLKLRPHIFIMLDVPDEILIDRCVGRRLDPVTGRIYHIKSFPPETQEISARLITRADDTQEKVKSRLVTYKQYAQATSLIYLDLLKKVNGNRPKETVFEEIDSLLQQINVDVSKAAKSDNFKVEGSTEIVKGIKTDITTSSQDNWRGIPTRLNNIPHSREIRKYFYSDVLQATQRAIEDKRSRLKVEINIPELNPEMDVYRIGTLMELVRTLALSFADDGKHVKICVQGSMGEGALAGMPLQLAGTRTILEVMDWGEYGAKGTFIDIGKIGAKEVSEKDDIFILVAPQNAVGNCIIDDLRAMTDAAGDRPVILVNPRLKDLPASSGIMQTMGRDKRLEYAQSFENCYFFRLLYYAGTQYPIMGALRMSHPYRYELFKRIDDPSGKEKYVIIATFPQQPTVDEINDAFNGKSRLKDKTASGFWGFLNGILST